MVDWGTSGSSQRGWRKRGTAMRSESRVGMLQQDDPPLNVMDYVEIEYKPDLIILNKRIREDALSNVRPMVKIPPDRVNDMCSLESCSTPSAQRRVPPKRKKRKGEQKPSRLQDISSGDLSVLYPYAACLKTLCERAACQGKNTEHNTLSEKLFDTLRTVDVHFPYASLLEELHQNVEAGTSGTNTPSTSNSFGQRESRDFEIADVMRKLHYPTRNNEYSRRVDNSRKEDFSTPFSEMLSGMYMRQQIESNQSEDFNEDHDSIFGCPRVGDILKKQMPLVQELAHPPNELQTSALLQRLAFSAHENQSNTQDRHCSSASSTKEVLMDFSSTDSSQSEDELEWKPGYLHAKKISNICSTPRRRKSKRRKKGSVKSNIGTSIANNFYTHKIDADDCIPGIIRKHLTSYESSECESLHPSSSRDPSRLLELIMGSEQNDIVERTNTKAISKHLKHKGKRKATKDESEEIKVPRKRGRPPGKASQVRKVSEVSKVPRKRGRPPSSGKMAEGSKLPKKRGRPPGKVPVTKQKPVSDRTQVTVPNEEQENRNEPQSLLKEYLLKPAGEEIIPSENCDIPKIETNFLFSRLLQNFKNLAETSPPETLSERQQEGGGRESILRGMLVAGSNSTSDVLDDIVVKVEEDTNFSRGTPSPVDPFRPSSPLLDTPTSNIKCEPEVKVEVEEVFCKMECEEEVFECEVCFLQFSSGIDLSNHQVLFHCSEEQGSDPLVSRGVETLS